MTDDDGSRRTLDAKWRKKLTCNLGRVYDVCNTCCLYCLTFILHQKLDSCLPLVLCAWEFDFFPFDKTFSVFNLSWSPNCFGFFWTFNKVLYNNGCTLFVAKCRYICVLDHKMKQFWFILLLRDDRYNDMDT